jgi:hypothetical protein
MFWHGARSVRPARARVLPEKVLIRSTAEIEIIIQQAAFDIGADLGALGGEEAGR